MIYTYSHNASWGEGGQGEILRQMEMAYGAFPESRVYCRPGKSRMPSRIELPFKTFPNAFLFKTIAHTPLLRARQDWLTLLSDLDFDAQLSRTIEATDLFEGVMGQCLQTFQALSGRSTRRLLYVLNTHIRHLNRVLKEEHARLGLSTPTFIHPRMMARALAEIDTADAIRVLSDKAKQTFVQEGVAAAKIHVIHPSVNLQHFHPTEKKDHIFRVVTSSSVDPRKGIYYLLQAFDQARIPNSELVIIGGTGDRWSKQMLGRFTAHNPRIHQRFMDVMARPVEESFGQASVVVHPAIEDGYALTIPQALASGRPVIATRESGASELIRDGKEGYVVHARDVKGLKERLEALASQHTLRHRMSDAAPRAVAHLDYPHFIPRLEAYYREQKTERKSQAISPA